MPDASSMTAHSHPKATRGWRLLALKGVVFVVVIGFVGNTLRSAIAELDKGDWQLEAISVVWCGALYVTGLLPAGGFWWWLLRELGQTVRLSAALRAYFFGHLGKYVPGKALVVVLRAGMMKAVGADAALATVAVVTETLTMMACGAGIAFVLVGLLLPPGWMLALAAALAIATGGPTLPPLLNRLLRRVQPRSGRDAAVAALIGWRALAVGWLAMTAVWVMLGLSFAALLSGLHDGFGGDVQHYLVALAAVALATVAGFLSLLPGGLFVREMILLELLAPVVGHATALVAAVLLRLVWLVAELVVSGAFYLHGITRCGDRSGAHEEE